MALQRKRLLDEICQTAPQHEIAGLMQVFGFVRGSRICLVQEVFSKEASVAAAKLQMPAERRIRLPHRSEVGVYEQYGHWREVSQ
jgi:hypothetical protein